MAKGVKTGGRQKGSLNKTTASIKAAMLEAFERRGGVDALIVWADENPTEFYKLCGRLIPVDVDANVTVMTHEEALAALA